MNASDGDVVVLFAHHKPLNTSVMSVITFWSLLESSFMLIKCVHHTMKTWKTCRRALQSSKNGDSLCINCWPRSSEWLAK